jgi:hypothetical protein
MRRILRQSRNHTSNHTCVFDASISNSAKRCILRRSRNRTVIDTNIVANGEAAGLLTPRSGVIGALKGTINIRMAGSMLLRYDVA